MSIFPLLPTDCFRKLVSFLEGEECLILEQVSKLVYQTLKECWCVLTIRWGISHFVIGDLSHKSIMMQACQSYCRAAWSCFPTLSRPLFPIDNPFIVKRQIEFFISAAQKKPIDIEDFLEGKQGLDLVQSYQMVIDANRRNSEIDPLEFIVKEVAFDNVFYIQLMVQGVALLELAEYCSHRIPHPTSAQACHLLLCCNISHAFLSGISTNQFKLPPFFCHVIAKMSDENFAFFLHDGIQLCKSFYVMDKGILQFFFKNKEQVQLVDKVIDSYIYLIRQAPLGSNKDTTPLLNDFPFIASFAEGVMTYKSDNLFRIQEKQRLNMWNIAPLDNETGDLLASFNETIWQIARKYENDSDSEDEADFIADMEREIEEFQNKRLAFNDLTLSHIFLYIFNSVGKIDCLEKVITQLFNHTLKLETETIVRILSIWMCHFSPTINMLDLKYSDMVSPISILVSKLSQDEFHAFLAQLTPQFFFSVVFSEDLHMSINVTMAMPPLITCAEEMSNALSKLFIEYFKKCRKG